MRMAFEGVTGSHYSSTLYTMWRAYLLREQLGDRFGELVNVVVLWSTLRHAATRESGYYADDSKLPAFRTALFQRYISGKLKGSMIPLRRAEILGRRLEERIERRSMTNSEREQRKARREWRLQQDEDRKLYREMPHIDLVVIQKGFGFVAAMVRQHRPVEKEALERYVRSCLICSCGRCQNPRPKTSVARFRERHTSLTGGSWLAFAEFVAHANSVETAWIFYRPILDLGPPAKYWVEDFLESWITLGLPINHPVCNPVPPGPYFVSQLDRDVHGVSTIAQTF
jgi:hypothetical protein